MDNKPVIEHEDLESEVEEEEEGQSTTVESEAATAPSTAPSTVPAPVTTKTTATQAAAPSSNVSPVVVPPPAPVPPTYYSSQPPPATPTRSVMTSVSAAVNDVVGEDVIGGDALVAGFTATRFFTAVSLISAAGNMYSTNPGPHYIISGILLLTSKLMEYIGKCISPVPFFIGIAGSITMLIAGIMSVDRNQINIQSIGVMWIITGALLFTGHAYSLVKTYRTNNFIISTSKLLAAVGALFFTTAGIIMYTMEDIHEDNVHYFAEMFSYGGIFYLAHSITMGTGHKAVLERVYVHMEQQEQQQAQRQIQMQQVGGGYTQFPDSGGMV
eukprot:CAMPEP_0203638088 /NCGR_PEP_ID=MMETSP0088-20131115/4216_1 /ASSEMBLY_ACC=CAM_ASM_001087 /TAXON_ID=426623 /ORGANISM="Chaetoceros affinis, Strain CCMP159" /LENGTH=326 /DNA_ID=CAMNT_0050492653 /DNA_START=22 /DNA_END=1002 /DNA_ORIENTATION=-